MAESRDTGEKQERKPGVVGVAPVSGIYKILNTENGKKYIGSAIDIDNRWYMHRWHLQNGTHHNEYLQRAWNKYGGDVFAFSIVEECNPEHLIEREQSYLPKERTSEALMCEGYYNISPIAGSTLGVAISDDRKQKIAQKARERMADPAIRAKMSEKSKRQWQNPESREKSMKNQAEKIRALTERNRKNWEDPEYRERHTQRMRQLWKEDGRRDELSQKISSKAKARMQDSAARETIAEGMRKVWEDSEYRDARAEVLKKKRKERSALDYSQQSFDLE